MIRKLCVILSCGVAVSLLLCNQAPMPAQAKKDDLNKQITDLKKKVSDRDTTITQLNTKVTTNTASLKDKDTQIKTLTDQTDTMQKRLKVLEALKKAPYLHTVVLKLKKPDDAQVQRVYDEAFKTIAKIKGVRGMFIAKPADDDTPELAQKGYQLGLIVLLDDADALKSYLDDPLHQQFVDKMGEYWDKPIVYDLQRDLDAEKKSEAKAKKDAKPKDPQ
jgi:uncharacterized coiled-coil protein SlyX